MVICNDVQMFKTKDKYCYFSCLLCLAFLSEVPLALDVAMYLLFSSLPLAREQLFLPQITDSQLQLSSKPLALFMSYFNESHENNLLPWR